MNYLYNNNKNNSNNNDNVCGGVKTEQIDEETIVRRAEFKHFETLEREGGFHRFPETLRTRL